MAYAGFFFLRGGGGYKKVGCHTYLADWKKKMCFDVKNNFFFHNYYRIVEHLGINYIQKKKKNTLFKYKIIIL